MSEKWNVERNNTNENQKNETFNYDYKELRKATAFGW